MFDPAIADCGSQGTASSPSSVPGRRSSRTFRYARARPRAGSGLPQKSGGDERARTADLCLAKAALSQLSYIPTMLFTCPDCRARWWRRERDSNPRYAFTYTRFPVAHLRPLSHLSERAIWRWGWDSNPRYPKGYNGFRDRHDRPAPSPHRSRSASELRPRSAV